MLCSHAQITLVSNTHEMKKVAWCINLPGEKQKFCSETFAQEVSFILHSSPVDEKKFSPSSILHSSPSAFQGECATSPFSEDGEWEERGVTTPIVLVLLSYCTVHNRSSLHVITLAHQHPQTYQHLQYAISVYLI